jgi:uncharacterized protein (TIGR03067 family)
MRLPVLLVLVVGLTVAADNPPEDAVKQERKKLEGTWTVESATQNGKPLERGPAEIVFAGDQFTMQRPEKKQTMKYVLDPSRSPKTINFMLPKNAPPNAAPGHGIYELKGDTLRVAISPPDVLPKEFTDKDQLLLTLKRKKS